MINGCLDRHRCLLGTSVEKLKVLETFKINFIIPEDIAIMLTSIQAAMAEIQTPEKCGQMDGQTAFQLYIVDSHK